MSTRVAFVQSIWHRAIVDRAREGFTGALEEAGLHDANIDFFEVPGALELPLFVQRLAKSGRYTAIVAAGLIVDGGIYRHEFVSSAVLDGLMRVQLDADVPVLSAVLTPIRFHEHETHERFFADHFLGKGREVALACARLVEAYAALT